MTMMMEPSLSLLSSFVLLLTTVVVAQVHSDVSFDCAGRPADVIFVLDASNSIWKPDFKRQLEFVKDVVEIFKIGDRNMMVGVITYAAYPQLQFQLNYYYRKSDIRAAIDNIRQDGGYETRTADALRYLRERAFLEAFGSRRQVAHVAIVISDGRSDNQTSTVLEAAKVKAEGVHLFAVGVGKNLDLDELRSVASHPVDYYTFRVDSYEGLGRIKDLLAIKTCEVTHAPTTTPAPTTRPTTTTTITTTSSTTRARTTPRRTTRTTKRYTTTATTSTPDATTTKASTTKPVITTSTTTTKYPESPSTETLYRDSATSSFRAESVKEDSEERTEQPILGFSRTSDFDGSLASAHPEAQWREGPEHEDRSGIKAKVTLQDVIRGQVTVSSGEEGRVRPSIRFETLKNLDIREPPIYVPGAPEEPRFHELMAKNLTSVYELEHWRPETDEHGAVGELEQTKRRRKTTQKPGLDRNGNGNGNGNGDGNGDGNGNGNGNEIAPSKSSSQIGIWSFDLNGRLVREEDSDGLVDVGHLQPIPEDRDMFIEGDEIWIIEKTGRRRLIGCIINGTHYIGHWIFDENGNRKWYGYPSTDLAVRVRNGPPSVIESAEHRLEPELEKDGSRRSLIPTGGSSSVEPEYVVEEEGIDAGNGEDPDTEIPLTDEAEVPGYWGEDDHGRDVYYVYIGPGVYELVYPEADPDEADGSPSAETSTETFPTEDTKKTREEKEDYHRLVTSDPGESQTRADEAEENPLEVLDPEGRSGFWGTDERGRQVWYLYTCPGVYVPVPEGPATGQTDENGRPVAAGDSECAGVDDDGEFVVYTYVAPGKFRMDYPDSSSTPEVSSESDPFDPFQAVGGKPESSLNHPQLEIQEETPVTSSPSVDRDSTSGRRRKPGSEFVDEKLRPEASTKPRSGQGETGKPEVGVYEFDSDGNFQRVRVVDAPNLKSIQLNEDDEVYVEGEQIWVKTKTGNRKLIGCVINGTHYIGVWVYDDDGSKSWYGYPSENLADRLRSDKDRSRPTTESSDRDALQNERRVRPNLENGDEDGHWEVDQNGDPVWHRLIRVEEPTLEPQEFRGNLVEADPDESLELEPSTRVPLEDWTPLEAGKRRGNNVVLDPNGKTGYWEPDKKGRRVWHRYTCPGVYEPVPEGPPSVSAEDLESGEPEVDGELRCSVQEEDGSEVWYTYIGPGEFRKVPRNSSADGVNNERDDDVGKKRVMSSKDEREKQKHINKTKHQPFDFRSTTVAPPVRPNRPRPAPTDPGKRAKHPKPTKDTSQSESHNGETGKGCRPREPLDLVFVIDSKSDDDTSGGHLWNLTRDILSRIDLDDDRIDVRFIQDCETGSSHFDLGEFENKENLIEALDSTLRLSSSSSSSAQLIQNMADAFKRDDGRHGDVARRRVGVYVTDGKSDDIEETVKAAQTVKFADDVEMFAIGVGSKVNPTELRAIASCEVDRHYYALSNHSKAATVARKISKALCLGR